MGRLTVLQSRSCVCAPAAPGPSFGTIAGLPSVVASAPQCGQAGQSVPASSAASSHPRHPHSSHRTLAEPAASPNGWAAVAFGVVIVSPRPPVGELRRSASLRSPVWSEGADIARSIPAGVVSAGHALVVARLSAAWTEIVPHGCRTSRWTRMRGSGDRLLCIRGLIGAASHRSPRSLASSSRAWLPARFDFDTKVFPHFEHVTTSCASW